MTVCSYYLQGRCRYGDKCWNEHPRGGRSQSTRGGGGSVNRVWVNPSQRSGGPVVQPSSFSHGGGDWSRGSSGTGRDDRSSNFSFNTQNRFSTLDNTQNGYGRTGGRGGGDEADKQLEVIQKDMEVWESSGQWLFSCYSALKDSITGFVELSPEELRMEYYTSRATGDVQSYVNSVQQLANQWRSRVQELRTMNANTRTAMIAELSNPSAQASSGGGGFGSLGSSGFGSSSTSGFGSSSTSGFGSSSSTGFESSSSTGFGASATGFGASATGFGASSAPTTSGFGSSSAPTTSGFGSSSAPTTSGFGSSSASGFGSSSAPTTSGFVSSSASTTSEFGSSSSASGLRVGVGFGSSASGSAAGFSFSASSSGFGSSVPQPAASQFGSSAPSASSFSFSDPTASKSSASGFSFSSASTAPPGVGGFGSGATVTKSTEDKKSGSDGLYTPQSELTPDELREFTAKRFTLGQIPLRPPPAELLHV